MCSQPPLLSSTGFSLFTGKVPLLPEPDTGLSFSAPKLPSRSTLSGAETGFAFAAGKMPSFPEFSFSAPNMPSPPTVPEAETGSSSSARPMSLKSSLSESGEESMADTSENLEFDQGSTTDERSIVLQNRDSREQKQQRDHQLTKPQPQPQIREPNQVTPSALSHHILNHSSPPSLTTTLYTTTVTTIGVILSPALSIFIHLLSMLSIRSLRQEIQQLERETREKDEVIRRLEEKIVMLEERERGLFRGEDLIF